jgi:hypothetical protein
LQPVTVDTVPAAPTDPERARALLFDLIDQGQVFVTLGILDLIDADRRNGGLRAESATGTLSLGRDYLRWL